MPKSRKIIVYIATGADGYIARKDGSVDWLDRPRPPGDYGMGAFFKTIDTILWGSNTYGVALKMNAGDLSTYGSKIKNYVFTHHPPKSVPPGVEASSCNSRQRRLDDGRRRNYRVVSGCR